MNALYAKTFGWIRCVMASSSLALLLNGLFVAIASVAWVYHHFVGWWLAERLWDYSQGLKVFVVFFSLLCGMYGLLRGLAFHPALDYRYHTWLRATPWAPGRPLPKGPLMPTWQDGVLLSLATGVCAAHASQTSHPSLALLGPTIMMTVGALLAWTAANFVTRNTLAIYATLFVVPVTYTLLQGAEVAAPVALVAGAVTAYVGMHRGLSGYPWEVFPRDKEYLKRLFNPSQKRSINWQLTSVTGWPYTQLLKPPTDLLASAPRAIIEAAVAAAWAATMGRAVQGAGSPVLVGWVLVSYLAMGLAMIRLVVNCTFMCSRVCVAQRIVQRRPLIWRHDRLVLEPLVILCVTAVFATIWRWAPPAPHWVGFAATAASLTWLFRRMGRPAAERFYTGPQSVVGMIPQPACFKPLAAPGD